MKIHCLYDKLLPIGELKPHPKNRNKHPNEQIERLAKVLGFQGWRYPIKVSNRSGFITSGHGRLAAAKLRGWASVPVNFQDYDSEEQEIADVTSDNAIASWAELDFAAINMDVTDLGPDFDIDHLGLKNFLLEPAEKFIADDHWSEDFEAPDQYSRIILTIYDDSRRDELLKLLKIEKVKKSANNMQWSARWPQ